MQFSSNPPKYMIVRNAIVESIQSQQLAQDDRLAPIAKMSVHFGVSPSVIQKALNQLVDDGFVECRGSRGYYVTTGKSAEKATVEKTVSDRKSGSGIRPVNFICGHHSDLVWRRTYAEADQVRKEQTEHLIKLAEKNPEFCFYFEQSETPVRLPEFHKRLKALQKKGQVDFIGGMCIPDLNMISGETFLRTLLYGKKDYREQFDWNPETACLSDAFGMPYQIPQALALCGYKYLVAGRTPNPPEGLDTRKPFIWNGANDTSILVSSFTSLVDNAYTCNVPLIRDSQAQIRHDLERASGNPESDLLVFFREEGLIADNICSLVEQANRKNGRKIRFNTFHNFFKQIESDPHPRYVGEFNPIFTGCYTTRIGNKQRLRKAEKLIRRAEILAAAAGETRDFEKIERELLRVAFHDSACGCCTDAAQQSIDEKFEYILPALEKACAPTGSGKKFFIANTSSVKGKQLVKSAQAPAGIPSEKIDDSYYFYADLPALGGKMFQAGTYKDSRKKIKNGMIKTDHFTADFNGKYPQIKGRYDVFGKEFAAIRLRVDYGSMWTELFRSQILADDNCVEGKYTVTEGPLFYHAETEGEVKPKECIMTGHVGKPWNGFGSLSWKKDFYFPKESDYFFLKLTIDFKGFGTKVFVEFSHKLTTFELERTDSVPFGSIIRKPYFEVENQYESTLQILDPSAYKLANGDWPVLDWNDFSDGHAALAIANSGTPGCWAAGDKIRFSLLRSGTMVQDGSLYPDPGSFDNGKHEYWFAFRAHDAFSVEQANELANILNGMPCESEKLPEGEWLSWNRDNVALSAVQQENDARIVRFYEYAGKQSELTLSGSWVTGRKIAEILPTGEIVRDAIKGGIQFEPFEIKTFKIY